MLEAKKLENTEEYADDFWSVPENLEYLKKVIKQSDENIKNGNVMTLEEFKIKWEKETGCKLS